MFLLVVCVVHVFTNNSVHNAVCDCSLGERRLYCLAQMLEVRLPLLRVRRQQFAKALNVIALHTQTSPMPP